MTEPAFCVLEHRREPDRPRRPVPGLLVCAGHRARTFRHLAQLAPLHALLGQHAAASAAGPKVSGTPEQRIPYDDRAASLRRHIRQKLASWVLMVAQERRWTLPRVDTRSDSDRMAAAISDWLAVHHDWLLKQTYLDDYTTDLSELHSAAWAVCYPSGRARHPIGTCPACAGQLVVVLGAEDDLLPDARCTGCAHTVPPSDWPGLATPGSMATAVELSALWQVPVGTIQRWAHLDRWPRETGRPTRYDAARAQETYNRMRPEPDITPAGLSEPYSASLDGLTRSEAS